MRHSRSRKIGIPHSLKKDKSCFLREWVINSRAGGIHLNPKIPKPNKNRSNKLNRKNQREANSLHTLRNSRLHSCASAWPHSFRRTRARTCSCRASRSSRRTTFFVLGGRLFLRKNNSWKTAEKPVEITSLHLHNYHTTTREQETWSIAIFLRARQTIFSCVPCLSCLIFLNFFLNHTDGMATLGIN